MTDCHAETQRRSPRITHRKETASGSMFAGARHSQATMSSLRRAWVRLPRLLTARSYAGLALERRNWVARPLRGGSVAPVQRLGLRFFSKVDVPTPELGGESITEGTIAEWTAKVGENVKKDQVIATIETDKVTVDVKAPQDGQLLEIKLQADETCEVGQVLAVLGPPGEGGVAAEARAGKAGAQASAEG